MCLEVVEYRIEPIIRNDGVVVRERNDPAARCGQPGIEPVRLALPPLKHVLDARSVRQRRRRSRHYGGVIRGIVVDQYELPSAAGLQCGTRKARQQPLKITSAVARADKDGEVHWKPVHRWCASSSTREDFHYVRLGVPGLRAASRNEDLAVEREGEDAVPRGRQRGLETPGLGNRVVHIHAVINISGDLASSRRRRLAADNIELTAEEGGFAHATALLWQRWNAGVRIGVADPAIRARVVDLYIVEPLGYDVGVAAAGPASTEDKEPLPVGSRRGVIACERHGRDRR